MKDKHDQDQSSQLDEILKELEARFAGESPSKYSTKKSRKSFFSSFTQSQIIGGLTLVLLVIGSAVGLYLGQTNQENREQASNVYPQCSNTTGSCANRSAGSSCTATLGEVGTCQNSDTNANCTCVPGAATVTPSGNIPNCSADPFCNPSCAGDDRCNKLLCTGIVSGSSPFLQCMWGGQVVTLSSCDNQSCGPAPTETCTPTGFCVGGSNTCCNGEVPVFNPTMCNANSRTWCPPAATATGIQATTIPNQPTTAPNQPTTIPGQPTNPPSQPTNPPLPTNTSVPVPTNTSVPTTPGAPTNTPVRVATNTSVPLPTNTNSPRPTNTSVPVPTNTSVPNNNGGPTNTPVPVPTNTSVPLSTFTPTSSLRPTATIIAQAPVVSATLNPTAASTATTQPTQSQVTSQNTALPRAGNTNQNVQFILAAISIAVLTGAVVLLFLL